MTLAAKLDRFVPPWRWIAASVAGFAVALGCTHRGAPASVMLEPLAVYPGVACEFPGGPDECTPGECPLVRIAVERVYGVVSTQLAEGASRAAGKLWRRFFGGGQPPSGAG